VPAAERGIVRLSFTNCRRPYAMPQRSPQPPKQRKRRSSSTRFLAAGLPIRSIEYDPITGKCTLLVGEPTPAKVPAEDADLDRELTEWEERRGR
jgi:hypothetical protein